MVLPVIAMALVSAVGLVITEPQDGVVYGGDWLTLNALAENGGQPPDSVVFTLNGSPPEQVPRLVTDWYTYLGNNHHTGFSNSPAPADGSVLWTAPVTGDTHEFCGPVVVDGIVYFASDQQSTLFALDAYTGEILWEYDVVNHVDDAVTWYQGRVYVPADSAWCLDALTGERIWAFKPSPGFKMNGTPAVADGVAYFTHAPDWSNTDVCALDASTGDLLWQVTLPAYSTGCVTVHNDLLFVPTYVGSLYALDTADGGTVWENSDSPTGYWDSSPVYVDGTIYICGFDGYARGIMALTGETIWQRPISPGIRYIAATPAFGYGSIFFADQVDSFHRLSAPDGSVLWSVPGVQHGSPALADGTVFFGQGADRANGQVRALDIETGQELWSYQTGGTEVYSSPAVTDGVVYIAGMDWNLYAFGSPRFTYRGDLFAQVGSNQLIAASYFQGAPAAADTVVFTVTGTGTGPSGVEAFLRAAPNPFSASTNLGFTLDSPGYVSLRVFDLTGRPVASLLDGGMGSGPHSVSWNGTDPGGSPVPSGMYFARLTLEGYTATTGLCVLR